MVVNNRNKWSDHEVDFLIKNYQIMSFDDMAQALGRSIAALKNKAQKLRLKKSRYWTQSQIDYLRQKYADTNNLHIAEFLNKSLQSVASKGSELGLKKSAEFFKSGQFQINGNKGHFKPGRTPHNKGLKVSEYMTPQGIEILKGNQYKPGRKAYNYANVGSIRVVKHGSQNYKWIKLGPKNWQLLHHYFWIKQHGEVPQGYLVTFINGNTMDCDLNNLKLITQEENMLRNSKYEHPQHLIPLMAIKSKLNKQIKKYENSRN